MADLANCRITFVQDLRRLVERWAAHDLCNRPPPILRSLGLSLPALAGPLRRPADGGIALARPAARPLALQAGRVRGRPRSEEHTSELQSLMRISYAVFCLKKKKQ